MTVMLVSLEISNEHTTFTHGVLSILGHVDRRFDRIAQLELVRFDGDDLDQRHLFDELLRLLIVEAVLICVPPGAFYEEASNVAAMLKLLLNVLGVTFFGHYSVHDGFIESPLISTACCLNEGSEVRLRGVKSTEPHDLGFSYFIPLLVLRIPQLEVLHPSD